MSTPEKIVRAAGISPQKYSYIKDLCMCVDNVEIDLDGLKLLPDEEIIAILDDIKGIGRWTAEMFLIFSLYRADVFALDDLGLRNAIAKAYKLKKLPDRKKMLEISKKWEPYRSVAVLYLWRNNDTVTKAGVKKTN